MDTGSFNEITREALYVLIAVSSPILILSLAVGLIISLFQALTQIQETTLTFVPKILTIYISMLIILPYMLSKLKIFTDHIIQHITQYR
ncbi:Flagellar biosynthetic protein FliQ [Candidatus Trichorickettsia mobilis]|jgi:flagellar biosynthetic protein FliQ|uniref:Flagellar biosynthetic protein FliQ n=1 Tax=Candidatus Trichorickettsia mobilis TaxID=1346319 RepID=A0ABZ0URP0_9RICK|nr:flagellar biosynthesis protein FliQ [Candidatus Trichorickettsia mobilis]WPY00176.1 Flagellar biosynthetic protein FliQ [Candidatus Trichorickettsia mobilis]